MILAILNGLCLLTFIFMAYYRKSSQWIIMDYHFFILSEMGVSKRTLINPLNEHFVLGQSRSQSVADF